MNSLIVPFIFIITACSYGEETKGGFGNDDRIVGGRPADISKFGWQVSLQKPARHSCGGSILSNYWVVTAAHCIKKNVQHRVRVGSPVHAAKGFMHDVIEIVVHPEYNKTAKTDNDVALLRVSRPFRLNGKTIRPVKLPEINKDLPTGAIVSVSGWGHTEEGGSSSIMLQAVSMPIFDWNKCKNIYAKNGVITENMICAGVEEGGKDSCQGDSGGPLVSDNEVLYGIVSWGRGCARPGIPGVYTRVVSPSVRNFIKEYTRL